MSAGAQPGERRRKQVGGKDRAKKPTEWERLTDAMLLADQEDEIEGVYLNSKEDL